MKLQTKMPLETDVKMGQLSALQRFKLIGVLNSLPEAQFNQVVLALNPPSGLVAPRGTSKGDRTFDLFAWLESPSGPGLEILIVILKEIPSSDIEEFVGSTSPRYKVTLDVDADNMDVNQLQQLIRGLGAVIGDNSIRIINVDRGSLKLDITGEPDKLKHLLELFESGNLTEITGIPITSIESVVSQILNQQDLPEDVNFSDAVNLLAERYFTQSYPSEAEPLHQETLEVRNDNSSAEFHAERQQRLQQIGEMLENELVNLDNTSQTLLRLYYEQGLTQSDIAGQLGIKQYQVSRKLSRIRQKLLLSVVNRMQETLDIPTEAVVLANVSEVIHKGLQRHYSPEPFGSVLENELINLDSISQTLLKLHYEQGLAQSDISEQLNIDQDQVSQILNRTRQKLLQRVVDWGQETLPISTKEAVLTNVSEVIQKWLQRHYLPDPIFE